MRRSGAFPSQSFQTWPETPSSCHVEPLLEQRKGTQLYYARSARGVCVDEISQSAHRRPLSLKKAGLLERVLGHRRSFKIVATSAHEDTVSNARGTQSGQPRIACISVDVFPQDQEDFLGLEH